jgi:hypothetical protein
MEVVENASIVVIQWIKLILSLALEFFHLGAVGSFRSEPR